MQQVYLAEIELPIRGDVYIVKVTEWEYQPPSLLSPHNCWSDLDYYGWRYVDFEIWDYDDQRCEDLEAAITRKEKEQIGDAVQQFFNREGEL